MEHSIKFSTVERPGPTTRQDRYKAVRDMIQQTFESGKAVLVENSEGFSHLALDAALRKSFGTKYTIRSQKAKNGRVYWLENRQGAK